MGLGKLFKSAAAYTEAVVEKSASIISSALSKEESDTDICYSIENTPDWTDLKNQIMLDYEAEITINETDEIESDNDDKIIIS